MKRLTLILLFLPLLVAAQLIEVHHPSPGVAGMVSNIGVNEYGPNMFRYSLNVNVTNSPGKVGPRFGLKTYGNNNAKLFGAYGYYEPVTQTKNVVGVEIHGSLAIGLLAYSDTFATAVQTNDVGGTLFPWRNAHHDWTQHRGFLIHADGETSPFLFTTRGGFKMSDSLADSAGLADTLGYLPRTLPLSMEAPGQLRPIVADSAYGSDGLRGKYQYALSFWQWKCEGGFTPDSLRTDPNGADSAVFVSQPGITSVPVYPDNQAVIITLFDNYPTVKSDTNDAECLTPLDSTVAWLLRRKIDGQNAWRILDTVYYGDGDTVVYIDSILAEPSLLFPRGALRGGDTTDAGDTVRVPQPGSFTRGFIELTTGGSAAFAGRFAKISADTTATTHYANIDSAYATRYSYFDPITGQESPGGPIWYSKIDTMVADSLFSVPLAKGLSGPTRPSHIRIWQGLKGDSATFYLLFEGRANHFTKRIVDFDTLWFNTGQWSDIDVQAGLDTADITVDTIFDYQIPVDINGDVIVRSAGTFVEGLKIPASDIAKAHDRFYAIGDPEFPNRVYYSRIDTAWSWPAINFYRIDESVSDEFVALEELNGTLYAFKHNSIWFLTEGSAEYEDYWGRTVDADVEWRSLTRGIGAVSRKTIVKQDNTIYFLGPRMSVWTISGSGLQAISDPVANLIDSMFTSAGFFFRGNSLEAASRQARLYSFNRNIVLQNDSAAKFIGYNTFNSTWGLLSFDKTGEVDTGGTLDSAYVPLGSFAYDSSSEINGLGSYSDLLFIDTTTPFAFEFGNSGKDTWTIAPPNYSFHFPMEFELSAGGDGVNMWEVQRIDALLHGAAGSFMKYWIYDGYSPTALAAGSVLISTASDSVYNVSLHVAPHTACKYPFVRLGLTPLIKVYFDDVVFITNKVGALEIQ